MADREFCRTFRDIDGAQCLAAPGHSGDHDYPRTVAEQWASYERGMEAHRIEMERYRNGERPAPPPRPIRPHTPGWRSTQGGTDG